jgi:hypothetical protein
VEALERLLPTQSLGRMRARTSALARGQTTYRALADRGYHQVAAPDPPETPFEVFAERALSDLGSNAR